MSFKLLKQSNQENCTRFYKAQNMRYITISIYAGRELEIRQPGACRPIKERKFYLKLILIKERSSLN
jgi:hypothetical protein